MKVVYIAGKFRGPNAWAVECNVREAEALSLKVWAAGFAALCPHTNTRHFDGTLPDHVWLEGTLEIMRRCDAVLLVSNWRDSAGARAEREEAIARGMPVFETIEQIIAWAYSRKECRELDV